MDVGSVLFGLQQLFWTGQGELQEIRTIKGANSGMKYVLTIAAALLIGTGSHAAAATKGKTVPNGPSELIGTYGNSPAQCRSYHRKADTRTIGAMSAGGRYQ
jgi:hypothetical protein